MSLPDMAITGSTGALGGRVARRLAGRGVAQRLIVRDPATAPSLPGAIPVGASSYVDTAAMREALAGARTLLFVSGRETQDRLQQHLSVVEAAGAAGVEQIVYISCLAAAPEATFTLARQHHATEQAIREAGLRHTFLRSSLYADFVPFITGDDLVIRGPAGTGRLAWVSRDDIAAVASEVLLTVDEHDGRTYDNTGPESLSMAETAAILGRVIDREVRYQHETIDEARGSRRRWGAPDWEVEGWITSYAAIGTGEMDVVSDVVERISGRPAQALEPFLRANPELWANFLEGPGTT